MYSIKHGPRGAELPRAVCSLCAQELRAGERAWRMNGLTVCEDCFADFARAALQTFEITIGGGARP